MIEEAKTTSPEHNAINVSSKVLSPVEKSLLKRAHHLFEHLQILIGAIYGKSFVNKLRFQALKTEKNHVEDNPTSTVLSVEPFQLGNPPVKAKSPNINFRREKANVNSLETFIELVDLFQPCNYNKVKSNSTK